MKFNKLSHYEKEKLGIEINPVETPGPNKNETEFVPAPEEVARKAYFSYVNQGSKSGHEVQHWLAAEAKLIEERNRTRVHGFHNQT